MDALINELTIEQIPEGRYRKIAIAIGIENLYKLCSISGVGGTTIYIPKPEKLTLPARDSRIKKEFTGYNHFELSERYGVTERWVRKICGGKGCPAEQLNLLDNDVASAFLDAEQSELSLQSSFQK